MLRMQQPPDGIVGIASGPERCGLFPIIPLPALPAGGFARKHQWAKTADLFPSFSAAKSIVPLYNNKRRAIAERSGTRR